MKVEIWNSTTNQTVCIPEFENKSVIPSYNSDNGNFKDIEIQAVTVHGEFDKITVHVDQSFGYRISANTIWVFPALKLTEYERRLVEIAQDYEKAVNTSI